MARSNFYSWSTRFELDKKLRRMYYLYGTERHLVETAVDSIRKRTAPPETDHVVLVAGEVDDSAVWSALDQYPADDSSRRLVVVRDAERIEKWGPFEAWAVSRAIPQTVVVFVSNEEKVDSKLEHLDRIKRSGKIICCAPLAPKDAVAYIQSLGTISEASALGLLNRVVWDIAPAIDFMRKVSYFSGTVRDSHVAALTSPPPASDFVHELIFMRKRNALVAAQEVRVEDYGRTLGLLDHRLDAVSRIYRTRRRTFGMRDLIVGTKLPAPVVAELYHASGHYDPGRFRACAQALAFIDVQWNSYWKRLTVGEASGEPEGLLETLVALW